MKLIKITDDVIIQLEQIEGAVWLREENEIRIYIIGQPADDCYIIDGVDIEKAWEVLISYVEMDRMSLR